MNDYMTLPRRAVDYTPEQTIWCIKTIASWPIAKIRKNKGIIEQEVQMAKDQSKAEAEEDLKIWLEHYRIAMRIKDEKVFEGKTAEYAVVVKPGADYSYGGRYKLSIRNKELGYIDESLCPCFRTREEAINEIYRRMNPLYKKVALSKCCNAETTSDGDDKEGTLWCVCSK